MSLHNIKGNMKVFTNDMEEREEVIVGGISDAFYGRPEEDDRVYFLAEDANWLLKADLILECLMKHGVAHFEGYDEAMEEFTSIWKGKNV